MHRLATLLLASGIVFGTAASAIAQVKVVTSIKPVHSLVAAVMDDHWNVKYDADGVVYETEAQHLTLVSPPSKKRAAAATPKKKARKVLV